MLAAVLKRAGLVCVMLLFATASYAQELGRRVALVIGNGAYERPEDGLINPPNDARDMAVKLRELGIEVIEAVDQDYRGMRSVLRQFDRALQGADAGLFFYAGHGMEYQGSNYLFPTDAVLETEGDIGLGLIDVDQVMQVMETAVDTRLLFLDACRNNPLARRFRSSLGRTRSASVGNGLAQMDATVGTFIAYATAPGNVASDGEGDNSPFTTALLEHLEEPGLPVGQLMQRVRDSVLTATNDMQVPWDSSSLRGAPFVLNRAQSEPEPLTSPIQSPGFSAADTLWDALKDSTNADEWAHFALTFPGDPRAALARMRAGTFQQRTNTAADTDDTLEIAALPPEPVEEKAMIAAPEIVGPDVEVIESADADLQAGPDNDVEVPPAKEEDPGFSFGSLLSFFTGGSSDSDSKLASDEVDVAVLETEEPASEFSPPLWEAPKTVSGPDAPDSDIAGPEAVEAALSLTRFDWELVQASLAALGYDPGAYHGEPEEGTREALRSWQTASNLEATGFLDKSQLDGLNADADILLAMLEASRTVEGGASRSAPTEQQGRVTPAVGNFVPEPGRTIKDCDHCPELMVVPAGDFQMGSGTGEPARADDEGPVRSVQIEQPFAVGRFEITLGQFARFVDATNHVAGDSCYTLENGAWNMRMGRHWDEPGFAAKDDQPATCVSWADANAYVDWLSDETGHDYRLMSEAEWEYVARAGISSAYHFGQTIDSDQANFNGASAGRAGRFHGQAIAVGSYEPNAFGLFDVHGNVWEWVADCYSPSYEAAPIDGSAVTAAACERRVMRGGSWGNREGDLRLAKRAKMAPDYNYAIVGFRVARTVAR